MSADHGYSNDVTIHGYPSVDQHDRLAEIGAQVLSTHPLPAKGWRRRPYERCMCGESFDSDAWATHLLAAFISALKIEDSGEQLRIVVPPGSVDVTLYRIKALEAGAS